MLARSGSAPHPDVSIARRLVTEQFPQWRDLMIEPFVSTGTQHEIYRLGKRMAIRFPRNQYATGQAKSELRWLSRIAPHLPLAVSVPLALGQPSNYYHWPWSVYPWIEGEPAATAKISDEHGVAIRLARFLSALQRISISDGPPSGRGSSLAERDSFTRSAIRSLRKLIDAEAAMAVWDEALRSAKPDVPLVWTHGDLFSTNLLINRGELIAVIDFGDFGMGDPACDLLPAWGLFSRENRACFRAELGVDQPAWTRGRGWALSISILALQHYRHVNPLLTAMANTVISEVLADHRCAGL
jgi:aminoglycoside phosphotransferase (APT) family kinase protein